LSDSESGITISHHPGSASRKILGSTDSVTKVLIGQTTLRKLSLVQI